MADKLTLPKGKFTHELTPASVEPTMKAAEATSGKTYLVPVDKIRVIPGFNVRVKSPDYIVHRDNIRASIATNGYDKTKPLAGYVGKEGDENVIFVTDGHTRLDAVNEHNADPDTPEANEIAAIPVIVHPKEVSLTDLTVALHTANNGRPLTPFELGIVVKRLLADEGADKKAIAGRLGVTTRYLDDVLLLANADGKVKQHVASGAISSTFAIQALRKDADGAAEKIEKAIKATEGTGKKATKKHAGPKMQKIKATVEIEEDADMKGIVKAVAAAVRKAVPSVASEADDEILLSTVAGSISLVIEIPAPEKAEKPKKAKAEKKAAKSKAEKKSDKKTEKKAKVAPEPEAPAKGKSKKAKKAAADLGIPGAEEVSDEGEDDETAPMPPKTKSDSGVPDDEDVDI